MKIIQTFWSGKYKSIQNNYGWFSYEYHWMGWMLSVHQLRKYYDEVELYTDSFGYEILIKKLDLPYTKVHVILDELNELPNDLWAMAKIKVYSLQTEPFLHVDGDVFIWEHFPDELLKSSLIVQNVEVSSEYYQNIWGGIYLNLNYIPTEMQNFHKTHNNFSFNMGVFGGNDIKFLNDYSVKSQEFVHYNKNKWNEIDLFNFNIFFEQAFLYEYVKLKNKKVEVLIKDVIGDNSYEGFGDFDNVPSQRTYLHLLGTFKRSEFICNKMQQYVFRFYPDFIKLLQNLIPEKYNNFNFEYLYTLNNNVKLISEFEKKIGKKEHVDTPQCRTLNLLKRDLYTQNQIQKLKLLENSGSEYVYFLLKDYKIKIINKEKLLYVKEIYGESFAKKINTIDEILLQELYKPKTKNSLYNKVVEYLEADFKNEEIISFYNIINETLLYFIKLKLVIVIGKNENIFNQIQNEN